MLDTSLSIGWPGTVIRLETGLTGVPLQEETPLDDGETLCPYCDDYSGKPDSVRGHIRAKTDPAHKGKSGYEDYTEKLLDDYKNPGSPGTKRVPERVPEQETEQADGPNSNDTETNRVTEAFRGFMSIFGAGVVVWLADRLSERFFNRPQEPDDRRPERRHR